MCRGLGRKIEWLDTPKRGDWLNVTEMELGVRVRPCLERRMPNLVEARAGEGTRNAAVVKGGWQFTATNAVKLKKCSPPIDPQ